MEFGAKSKFCFFAEVARRVLEGQQLEQMVRASSLGASVAFDFLGHR